MNQSQINIDWTNLVDSRLMSNMVWKYMLDDDDKAELMQTLLEREWCMGAVWAMYGRHLVPIAGQCPSSFLLHGATWRRNLNPSPADGYSAERWCSPQIMTSPGRTSLDIAAYYLFQQWRKRCIGRGKHNEDEVLFLCTFVQSFNWGNSPTAADLNSHFVLVVPPLV